MKASKDKEHTGWPMPLVRVFERSYQTVGQTDILSYRDETAHSNLAQVVDHQRDHKTCYDTWLASQSPLTTAITSQSSDGLFLCTGSVGGDCVGVASPGGKSLLRRPFARPLRFADLGFVHDPYAEGRNHRLHPLSQELLKTTRHRGDQLHGNGWDLSVVIVVVFVVVFVVVVVVVVVAVVVLLLTNDLTLIVSLLSLIVSLVLLP